MTGTILVRLGVAAVAVCTGFAWAYAESLTAIPQPLVRLSVGLCILFACGVGLGAALLGWLHKRDFRRSTVGIYALVVLEVVVLAVRLHPPRRSSSEPEDAPVVRRLPAEPNGDCRVFGDYPLFPNTASGVQIPDLRILDPILPKNLVSSFQELAGSPIWSRFSFREFDDYEHPALDFLGVRYVVSTRDVRNLLLRPRPTEPRHRLLREPESGRGIQLLLVEPGSVQTFHLPCGGGGIALLVQLTSGKGGILRVGHQSRALIETELAPGFSRIGPYEMVQAPPPRSRLWLTVETAGDAWVAVVEADTPEGSGLVLQGTSGEEFFVYERRQALPIC